MKKKFKILVYMLCVLVLIPLVSGCNQGKQTLKIFNWGEYIAEDLIKDFEAKYNIKVVYDTYDTNEDMYTKIKSAGKNSYDIVVPSDYMIKKMIDENMLAEIDFNNIPNYKNIADIYKNTYFDEDNKYSIPYFVGTIGILYNKKIVTSDVNSFNVLFDDNYKNKIFMSDDMRNSIGVTLKSLGYSMNSVNDGELLAAKNKLLKQKKILLGFATDEVKDKMVSGEGGIALTYQGVAMEAIEENKDLDYVIPNEGTNIAIDSMVILKNSQNKKNAELFMNYMLEPENAKVNSEEVGYATPNVKGKELLPEEIRNDTRIYPTDEVVKNCELFYNLSNEDTQKYTKIWTEIKSAN